MSKISTPNGQSFEVENDKRLVLALVENGVDILHRCGGNARCTTCRVKFIAGEPATMTQAEHDKLAERELLGEYRLSCQILCSQDMTVEPAMGLLNSGLEDRGGQPAPHITPEPVWIERSSAD